MDSHIVGIYYHNYWHLLDLIIPFRRKSPYHHHGLSHLALHFVPSNGRFFAEVSEIYVDIERERKENYHRHCKTEKSNCFSGCGAPTMLWIRDMEHHYDCATSVIIPLTVQEDALSCIIRVSVILWITINHSLPFPWFQSQMKVIFFDFFVGS